ncbi:type VI secretion system lipoprotein TssJ [Ideonella paludis]|uniref:type VI secretion system lipoprotein TssJ n=1 Tax=Ideonella paludis TaxID=1233411 RepID=UPI001FECBD00
MLWRHCFVNRFTYLSAVVLSLSLAACGSIGSGGVVDKSLEAVGLKKPDTSAVNAIPLPPAEYKVPLRIHAAEQLNSDPQGRSLSVVVRVYRLKETSAIALAPYDAFKNPDAEKLAFGSDVVSVREIVLTPGQHNEVVETLTPAAPYLAVVALFRSPAQGRWRFVFDGKAAQQKGVTLGVHGCALSVAVGDPLNAPPETLRLAGVRCQ